MLEFSIVTISTFVAMLNECTKYFTKLIFKKDIKKYIPIFSVLYGIILSIAGYYMTSVEMGNNIIEAIFIGISAGAAATGIHQIGKQFGKTDDGTSAGDDETDIEIPTFNLDDQTFESGDEAMSNDESTEDTNETNEE